MTRSEIRISLGAFAAAVVMLASLWGYLMNSTLYARPGVGKGPYNAAAVSDKPQH